MYTSNVFGVLWLRSLYFSLTGAIDQVRCLGLATLLVFVSVKMLLIEVYRIPIGVSLRVIVGVLAASIIASFDVARREGRGTLPGCAEKEAHRALAAYLSC